MKPIASTVLLSMIMMGTGIVACAGQNDGAGGSPSETVALPAPDTAGDMPLEQAIGRRRSVRDFTQEPLSKAQLGQLLWAAQGITDSARGYRSAPSAGATYPVEIYVAVGRVTDVSEGLYRYDPDGNTIERIASSDVRSDLYTAGLRQGSLADPPVTIAITAVLQRTAGRYGERARRYVTLEAGHVSQNIYLQAESLGLGTVAIGAFDDDSISTALDLRDGEFPLYLMPVGVPR